MPLNLSSPIRYLKGIGPKRAEALKNTGVRTLEDLLYYFPRRYEDRTSFLPIAKCAVNATATVKATVLSKNARFSFRRRGFGILEVAVADATGRLFAVWFNQPYLKNYFKAGDHLILHGKVELYKGRLQMASPDFEVVEESVESLDIGRIVPVYSLPRGILSQRFFRKIMRRSLNEFLPSLVEVLPYDIRSRRRLLNVARSLSQIHFPESQALRLEAYRRLSFEEFFLYQVPLILRKLKRSEEKGISFLIDEKGLEVFIGSLPFSLTQDQKVVLAEIKNDMAAPRPMQRLLQGDVGSGKTVVATLAALIAARNKYQAAFMVPTEILAQQHFEKISQLLASSQKTEHREQKKPKVGLLTSSLKGEEKGMVLKEIKNGDIDIIIGTHALLQEDVKFKKLGLIVIDEQHKFGVAQRALLPQKGVHPDRLIMTATPIPRTLSMTLYGDLDISFIRQMPQGRKRINTALFPFAGRGKVYDFVRTQVKEGRQAYLVYPIIEETPRLELSSAKSMYKEFSMDIFKDLRVGLVHGRLKQREQEKVMAGFRRGDLDILVATTVLEVGIDVPNATVMVVAHAERFGLSQLHQMRGRIGRGPYESYCFLVAEPQTEDAQARLRVLVENLDGFVVAEEDLKIRGPGEFFGERQHGLTELRIGDPLTQMHLLKYAREEAVRLLSDDPELEKRPNQEIKRQLYKRFPEFERFIEVG